MSLNTRGLAENVPESIFRGAKLQEISDQLFENFAKGEERNVELVNRFFNQPYFRGGESLINKYAEIQPNIDFDYIKDEAINLSLLLDENHLRSFQLCLNMMVNSSNIKKAINQEVFDKIKSRIGNNEPYTDFDEKCAISDSTEDNPENFSNYFKKIIEYLQEKESATDGKKLEEVLSGLAIINEDINNRLPDNEKIPVGVPLKESNVPASTRDAFDALLSFEIGKAADCAINIANNADEGLESLFTNSMPTISTIIGENDELKFDENKLGDEFKEKLKSYQSTYASALQTSQKEIEPIESEIKTYNDEIKPLKSEVQTYNDEIQTYKKEIETIKSNNLISKDEKEQQIKDKEQQIKDKRQQIIDKEQQIKDKRQQIKEKEQQINEKRQQVIKIENEINDLKRKYYLEDLKKKDSSLGEALELLYQNNFDYSKMDENPDKNKDILQKYLDKVADMRLKMMRENGTIEAIKSNFGNLEDYDEFENFYKNLVNLDKDNIELIPEDKFEFNLEDGATVRGIKLPIKKEIIGGPHPWLKKIDQFGSKDKSFDTLPIRYTIKKSAIDSLPISDDDKQNLHQFLTRVKTNGKEKQDENWDYTGKLEGGDSYIIEGSDIGILMYFYFLVNGRSLKDESSQEDQEKYLEEEKKNNDNEKEPTSDEIQEFQTNIEKLGPGKFENGSEIWLPFGKSELPGGGSQMMKIKISDVDTEKGTFKGTIFGGELNFSDKLEGKSVNYKMDGNTFERFQKNKACLLPNPYDSDFNDFVDNKLNNKLGLADLKFPPEGGDWQGTTWNGNKFIKEDSDGNKTEVKHFGIPGDVRSSYKIDYNPRKRSFTVSSTFNGEEKGDDGKSKKTRFAYKREMDWNNFLFFFTQKGLQPQTEEEAKQARAIQDEDFMRDENGKIVNGGNWRLRWFSLGNLKNGFKEIIGSIKKGIEDYDKEQTKDFKDIIEGPILKAISKVPLPPSIEYAVGKRQEEIYNEQYNGAWPKIEKYLKALQSDDQFADTFDQVPAHVQTLYGKSYKKFIEYLYGRKGEIATEEKRKAAALLLANIQKGGSPYRGLAGKENSGLWVKILLGNDHYKQFKEDKQKCIDALENAGDEKGQIEDVLATCEMDYIINNINGSNGKLKYFGSHEERGINGDNSTQYIPNPSKRILSEKFAKELKNSYKGRFDKSAVESSFSEIKHNDFDLAREDFLRFIKSGRFPQSISNLKKMFTLADNENQKSDYQKCFLIYMLSGVLDFNGKEDLRKQAYQWAKTMSFLPGMLAKNVGHSEQVVALLDDWSGGDFSKNVRSYFHKKNLREGEVEIEALMKEVNGWWNLNRMKDFEEYSKSKFPSKKFPEDSILSKLQKDALKSDMENIDNSLLTNDVVANSGGILSNANVVRDRMQIKDGEFDGTENKEKDNRKKFWKQIIEEVEKIDYKDPESVKLVLNQYFSWFGLNSESDRQKAYQWIKTAYYRKKHVGQPYEFDYTGKGNPEGYLNMGTISMAEIEDIIWYTFQGTVRKDHFSSRKLPAEMEEALKTFQNFFRNAFQSGTLENPTIEKDVFKSSGRVDIMLVGSRNLYKGIFSGDSETTRYDGDVPDDANFRKDAKQRWKAQKKAFQSGRFINHEIAQIEKTFKNRLPKTSYRVITQDTTSDIDTRIKWLFDNPEGQAYDKNNEKNRRWKDPQDGQNGDSKENVDN